MNDKLPYGVRLAGTGSAVPHRVVTNYDLEKTLDTSHEWIVQRTGIIERRLCGPGESTLTLSRDAITRALDAAERKGSDLELLIVGSCTQEMIVPSTACRVAREIGMENGGAFDVVAACSGFVYSLILADTLIRTGRYKTVGVIGCDALSNITDFEERTVSILFGDAAGAAVLVRDDDSGRGCAYQSMNADPEGWETLYAPRHEKDVLAWDAKNPIKLGCLRMQGREVYKFAVTKFKEVIEDALCRTRLTVDDVAQFICHQSNARIIESAKEKLALPDHKVLINIDRYGNSSAGSVGLCLDQLARGGKIKNGDWIILVAFGAGLTWASCVWKV